MVRLIKANIRKDRAFLMIFSLIIIMSTFLMNLGLLASQYDELYREYVDETNTCDYAVFAAYSYAGGDVDLNGFFENREYIEDYDIMEVVMLNSFKLKTSKNDEEKISTEWMFQSLEDEGAAGIIKFAERDDSVPGKKIYMNIYTALNNDLQVGDKVYIDSVQGKYEYTLAGIYQHLMMGSSYTYYSVMVDGDEFDRLKTDRDEALKSGADFAWDHMMYVHVKDGRDVEACLKDTKETIAEDYGVPDEGFANSEGSYSYTAVTNILAAFMGAFAALIMIICVIVVVFTMNNNINRDIRNIGALKAVGHTVAQIRRALMSEYIILGTIGSIIGIVISYAVYPILDRNYIMEISGLIWKNRFYPGLSLAIIAGVIIVFILTTFLSTMKVGKLHPANALRFGLQTSGSLRDHMPLSRTRGGVDILLAIKSFIRNRGQNVIVGGILFAASFVTVFSMVLYYNTRVDITNFQRMIMGDVADGFFYVKDTSPKAVNDSIGNIRKLDGVIAAYGITPYYAYVGDRQTDLVYSTDPTQLSFQLYEGRLCSSDDETVLGCALADELDLGVGDTIDVTFAGKTKTFKITGLQQSAMNNRLYVTGGAAEDLGIMVNYDYIRVRIADADSAKVDSVLEKGMELGDDNIINTENDYEFQHSDENTPVFAVSLIVSILVVLNVAIILLVIRLLLKTVFVKNEKEFGIKKALGFTSTQLRIQLSLSLIPATLLGSAAGAVAGYFFVNPLFGLVLSNYGLKTSSLIIRPSLTLAACVVVTLTVFISSYIMSHRMKKVSAYDLIRE